MAEQQRNRQRFPVLSRILHLFHSSGLLLCMLFVRAHISFSRYLQSIVPSPICGCLRGVVAADTMSLRTCGLVPSSYGRGCAADVVMMNSHSLCGCGSMTSRHKGHWSIMHCQTLRSLWNLQCVKHDGRPHCVNANDTLVHNLPSVPLKALQDPICLDVRSVSRTSSFCSLVNAVKGGSSVRDLTTPFKL